ncbi:proline-rich transmembrane protein 1-like [Ptychodera flava]|uniref:proline-rich transmembrane protein 1-like n=1 Tax=Ptychodera flava TaxID=63121 RepID=UPI003969C167
MEADGKPSTGYSRLPEEAGQVRQMQPVPPPSYHEPVMHGYPQAMPPPPQQPTQFTSANNTVVVAPAPQTMIHVQRVPDDHMGLAIFATICCFWPVGIFAILKARDVHKRAYEGDMMGSEQASRSARMLSLVSLGVGIGIIVLSIIIVIVSMVTAANAVNNSYYP